MLWVVVLVAVILVIATRVLPVRKVTVVEYQKALKCTKGRSTDTLDPGQYRIISTFSSIAPIDIRPAVEFQVADRNLALNKNANFRTSLNPSRRMALRVLHPSVSWERLY